MIWTNIYALLQNTRFYDEQEGTHFITTPDRIEKLMENKQLPLIKFERRVEELWYDNGYKYVNIYEWDIIWIVVNDTLYLWMVYAKYVWVFSAFEANFDEENQIYHKKEYNESQLLFDEVMVLKHYLCGNRYQWVINSEFFEDLKMPFRIWVN